MDADDLEPPAKKKPPLRDLDVMSVDGLEEYIAEMEAEIVRVRSKIAAKRAAHLGAESFFKK